MNSARVVLCANNQKQIGTAVALYADNYDNLVMLAPEFSSWRWYSPVQVYKNYYEGAEWQSLFWCPDSTGKPNAHAAIDYAMCLDGQEWLKQGSHSIPVKYTKYNNRVIMTDRFTRWGATQEEHWHTDRVNRLWGDGHVNTFIDSPGYLLTFSSQFDIAVGIQYLTDNP